jgi:uncharacterized protein YndB with AHSA1/START domain
MKSTEAKRKFEITTPGDLEIVMTRSFDAPRDLVFDAFTKPELVRRWLLGPDGWTMPVCEIDLRVDGAYRYRWRADDGHMEFGTTGVFRDVSQPTRIVHTEQMEGQPGEALITTVFAEENGATTVTMTILHESRAIRDMVVETGMSSGVECSYERLAEMLV